MEPEPKKIFLGPATLYKQVMCPLQDLANEELQGSLASETLALLSSSTGAPATADPALDSGRQQTHAGKNRISVHIEGTVS